jgi:hypothetical protein
MAKSAEEEFVNVWFGNEDEATSGDPHDSNIFYQRWLAKCKCHVGDIGTGVVNM